MQYSNTTDKNGILQRCEDYAGFADGGITGDTTTKKKFTSLVNETVYDLLVERLRSQDDVDFDDPNFTDYAIGTFALTTNRDYVFSSSLNFLKLSRLDVTYDGTNWAQATPTDSSRFESLGNSTLEDQNFSPSQPYYVAQNNGFWLYPKATQAQVDAGAMARIEFIRNFDEFTTSDTTQEPPIDRPFHDLVPLGASMKYLLMKNSDKGKNYKILWEEGLQKYREYYGTKNLDGELRFTVNVESYT